jgi:hypothetical protein
MQLIPRYLVSNRSTIIANEAGFVTEYRPVYSRNLQVYRGIDNVLEFKVLNADQKPINITNYTPKFMAFDSNNTLIVERDGVPIVGDDSAARRGLFTVTISENDLLNVDQQYVKYAIHLVDSTGTSSITYSNSHFGNNGTIYINGEAYPGPKESVAVTQFTKVTELSDYWLSSAVDAQPGINGNNALHTASVYASQYVGEVIIQATLDSQITESSSWADVATLTFDGSETEPTPVNFNGVFTFLRVKTTANPADKITKILIRN